MSQKWRFSNIVTVFVIQSEERRIAKSNMKKSDKRTVGLYTKVSAKEKAVIERKMEQLGTRNMRAYLRKMALDGYIIHVDLSDVKPLLALIRIYSNNLNQIAQRLNKTGRLYDSDIQDIQEGHQKIWDIFQTILAKLGNLNR